MADLFAVNVEMVFLAESEEEARQMMMRILQESKTFRKWSQAGVVQIGGSDEDKG